MTRNDIELIYQKSIRRARTDFLVFRKMINKNFLVNWWVEETAQEMAKFYEDLVQGKRPTLILQSPPQHGKSILVVDFILWAMGKDIDMRTIFTSFSDSLGKRANRWVQQIMASKVYHDIFPLSYLKTQNIGGGQNIGGREFSNKPRNQHLLSQMEGDGSFKNVTINGAITGEGLDLGIIDDPVKSREHANSITIRNKTWDWFTESFLTRFSKNAGLLVILTRWHIDDLAGRIIGTYEDKNLNLKVLSYPAIATKNEVHRMEGDPLFPELKPLDLLLEHKAKMTRTSIYAFEALYQQNPILEGGQIIKSHWFNWYDKADEFDYTKLFITMDTASKKQEHNDYTVMCVWGVVRDKGLLLLDMYRDKVEWYELRRMAINLWEKWKNGINNTICSGVYIEDKSSGTTLIQDFRHDSGIPVLDIQRNRADGDKATRLDGVISYIEAGKIYLPMGRTDITNPFLEECEQFSRDLSHPYDDIVDNLIDGINKGISTTYNKSLFSLDLNKVYT